MHVNASKQGPKHSKIRLHSNYIRWVVNGGSVRFLNGASDYNPFNIYMNDNQIVDYLAYSEVTEYVMTVIGEQMITIMGQKGYIYIQKYVDIPANGAITIAIVNADTGIDLFVVADKSCRKEENIACMRVANLSYNAGPLSVTVGDGALVFKNVAYKEVTDFSTIWPGLYLYIVTKRQVSGNFGFQTLQLMSSGINLIKSKNYTIYLMNWDKGNNNQIKAVILEES